jgi:hypothetical protein
MIERRLQQLQRSKLIDADAAGFRLTARGKAIVGIFSFVRPLFQRPAFASLTNDLWGAVMLPEIDYRSAKEAPPDGAVEISFMVPCLNEEKHVVGAIKRSWVSWPASDAATRILVFDDGSCDNTVTNYLLWVTLAEP